MPLTWTQSHPGARVVARSGQVDVGAVFPPCGEGQHSYPWVWRLWVNGRNCASDGAAKTELAAKNALAARWQDFQHRAGLAEVAQQ